MHNHFWITYTWAQEKKQRNLLLRRPMERKNHSKKQP